MTTVSHQIRQAKRQLQACSETPELDAEVLMQHALCKDRAWLIAHAGDKIGEGANRRFENLLIERLQGEPIAYLVGHREFWSLQFDVTPDVLIPRPETETLVELALASAPAENRISLLELGTGSGAIALSIALERPNWSVTATEKSPAALDIARKNATRLTENEIEFIQGDWFQPLAGRSFDLVVSNPPYVADLDPHLDAGDVRFEPRSALLGGADGLDKIRHILSEGMKHLAPGGSLMIEHGWNQGDAVRSLFLQYGYRSTNTVKDISGYPRVTQARH